MTTPPRESLLARAALCAALAAVAACSTEPGGFGRDGAVDARAGDAPLEDAPRDGSADADDAGSALDASDAADATPVPDALDAAPVFDAEPDAARCAPAETACMIEGRTACVDTRSDRAHCGACNNACPGALACTAGSCACPAGTTRCGVECVDTQSSGAHCGACGNACGAGQSCTAGVCTCPAGQLRCGALCVDPATNDSNCGSCGNECGATQFCAMGRCNCPLGQSLCGGACVDTQSSPAHCGACGTACAAGQLCNGGSCGLTCTGGRALCGAGAAQRCVDLQSDGANCGGCGAACPAGRSCVAGVCACPSGQRSCGDGAAATCVSVQTDVNHCGACGNACGAGRECRSGVCACAGGLLLCGTGAAATCVDGSSDVNNCGACGSRCASAPNVQLTTCVAGSCRQTCAPGFADCDNNPANGCEVDTRASATHCGRCGNACPAGQGCTAGACGCAAGQTLCGTGASAACRSLQSDNANCGACGNACPSSQTCQAGVCRCPSGQLLCGGVCVDPQTSAAHCGACNMACTGGVAPDLRTCRAGACQCPAGQTWCMAQNRCVNTQTDALNCGACGTACPAGQLCNSGACGLTCSGGATLCGTGASQRCANLQTDSANCGACGVACTGGKTCSSGACACPAGQSDCGGTCRTLASDSSNCGRCGNACPSGTTCSNNQCVCTTAGLTLCPACPAMTSCSPTAACLNLQTNNASCGACGRACPAGSTCAAGTCSCPAGQTFCASANACLNLQTNSAHCGACDNACTGAQSCVGGSCQSAFPAIVSVANNGAQADLDSYTEVHESVSGDGRYVAFTSYGLNLSPLVVDVFPHVYVRDRVSGVTQMIDVSTTGTEGNDTADFAVLSHDGRYVAFQSYATNLVAGVTAREAHIYVRDRTNNTTILASRSTAGVTANSFSQAPAISGNGRFVSFTSYATNLVAGADAPNGQIYLHDVMTRATTLISLNMTNGDANGQSLNSSISFDGRHVVFTSRARDIVTQDSGGRIQVYARDRTMNTTSRVSISSAGVWGDRDSDYAAISADGNTVVFTSTATNLTTGVTDGVQRVYVRNRPGSTTLVASRAATATGALSNGISQFPTVSSDGRYVAFYSNATNLVSGVTGTNDHVYVRDMTSFTTTLMDRSAGGVLGNQRAYGATISANGSLVVFTSNATNLVAGDTNSAPDVFITQAR